MPKILRLNTCMIFSLVMDALDLDVEFVHQCQPVLLGIWEGYFSP